MSAGFVQNMTLNDMSADMLNRIARAAGKLSMPRNPPPPPAVQPENNFMVVGINDTGQELVDRSIVAIFDEYYFDDGGIIARSARTRAFGDPVMYRFSLPLYPQPEPDEDGNIFWPFPDFRLGVIRAAQPVAPGELAHAMIYGHIPVHIRMNEPQEGEEPYRFATFVDQDTDILQSAPTGPAMIIAGEQGYAQNNEVFEATIFFPCTAQALEDEEEKDDGGGEEPILMRMSVGLCHVYGLQNNGRDVSYRDVKFNLEEDKYELHGERRLGKSIYGISGDIE